MRFLKGSILGFVLLTSTIPALATQTIRVETASGRSFRGQVDPRTDVQVLWLRSGKPNAFVRRGIDWRRVVSVFQDDRQHTAEQFRELLATGNPFQDDPDAANAVISRPQSVPEELPTHGVGAWEPELFAAISPRVTSIHIDAFVANWDADVEVDGLVVRLFPLDHHGGIVAALGTLEVELIGEGATNLVSGNPFPILGRWSKVVRPYHVGANGAEFRFPFNRVHPDAVGKSSVGSFGMVHARFAVAGDGVFEDTAAFTRIRPYSPVRDRLQQLRGTRFHPLEMTNADNMPLAN